jgi:hypothetical protein
VSLLVVHILGGWECRVQSLRLTLVLAFHTDEVFKLRVKALVRHHMVASGDINTRFNIVVADNVFTGSCGFNQFLFMDDQ